jgi:hypothetical protein
MVNWSKVTDNKEVIKLIKELEKIEAKIKAIDKMALINYQLEVLSSTDDKEELKNL